MKNKFDLKNFLFTKTISVLEYTNKHNAKAKKYPPPLRLSTVINFAVPREKAVTDILSIFTFLHKNIS